TVLLTTHYMEEADQLCDRVAIIDHGRIVALDTPAALKRTIRAEEVVHLEIGVDGDDAAVIDRLGRSATVARTERSNGTLNVTAHCASARDFVPAAFDAARSTGATIRHVEVVPVTLEDVFLALAERAGSSNVAVFVFVGYAMYNWLSSLLWGAGTALRQEQLRGTLEAVFVTPASRLVPLFGPGVGTLLPMTMVFASNFGALWIFF